MKVQTVKTYKKDKQSSSHAKYVSIYKTFFLRIINYNMKRKYLVLF